MTARKYKATLYGIRAASTAMLIVLSIGLHLPTLVPGTWRAALMFETADVRAYRKIVRYAAERDRLRSALFIYEAVCWVAMPFAGWIALRVAERRVMRQAGLAAPRGVSFRHVTRRTGDALKRPSIWLPLSGVACHGMAVSGVCRVPGVADLVEVAAKPFLAMTYALVDSRSPLTVWVSSDTIELDVFVFGLLSLRLIGLITEYLFLVVRRTDGVPLSKVPGF